MSGGGGGQDDGSGGGGGGGKGGDNGYSGGDYSSPIGDFAPSTPAAGYAPSTDTGGGSLDSFLGNPSGGQEGSYDWGTGAGPLDNMSASDFGTGGGGTNLAGSGPVGGDNGLPGEGGGTNTPFAFGTSSSMPGAGSDAGQAPGAAQPTAIDSLLNSGNASAGGASAASVAAPAGVAGIGDLTVNPAGIESGGGTKTTSTGGGNGSSDTGGLLKSLGVGSGGNGGLGVLAAGAGLLNNLINGRKDSSAVQALQGQAATNNARAGQIIDQGQQQNAGGQGDVGTGRNIISTGQGQLDKGTALQQYIATGTLPQGYEDQVQQAARDAKTAIVSRYATMGQGTDPLQNSQLQAELQQVDAKLPAMREQLASQLATSGNQIVGAGNQTIGAGNQTIGTGGSEGTQLISSGLQAAGISSGIYQTLANLDSQTSQRQSQAIANFAAALNNTPRSVTINTKAA